MLQQRGVGEIESNWLGFVIPLLQLVGLLTIPPIVENKCSKKLKLATW